MMQVLKPLSGVFLVSALGVIIMLSWSASGQKPLGFDWQIQQVDQGTKPALALDSSGNPQIVYMLERLDGWVKLASWNDEDWTLDTVAEGYFYGPPDLAMDNENTPHISYHDHQSKQFNPSLGDAIHAFLQGGQWQVDTLAHPGHDGWDNRVAIGTGGVVHISAIDPVDFDGQGVEYYRIDSDGTLLVETLGSGPLSYRYATAIAVLPDETPLITYYDQQETSLKLATRLGPNQWVLETVDNAGDTGLFSSIVVADNGAIHISYFERTSPQVGIVKHAVRHSGSSDWEITKVDVLDNVVTGFTGARNITSIVLDSSQQPWIAYSDEMVLKLAIFDETEWQTQTVAKRDRSPFGQIVSLKLDANNVPHIAFATVTDKRELDGFIFYATIAQNE